MIKRSSISKAIVLAVGATGYLSATQAIGQNEGFALEEVVVTAQKREEAYTDVPLAVSAFSGEVLDMAKVGEFQDLVQVSPSLTFNQTGDMRGVGILVRGIGTTAFQTAVEPTVSTVVDGVTMGRTVQFLSDLNDIERVEVLRGPQGTLFGKNASAGLINIITKRPADEFEASVGASLTDDDSWGVNAQVSGPISDAVRARVSAYTKEYDGWAKNLYTGDTVNGDESWGIRGKLEFDITDTANLLLIADYSKQDRNCCVVPPVDLNGNRFFEFDYRNATVNEKNNAVNQATPTFSNTETKGISAELNIDFENFVFTSITAYREFELETQQGFLPYTGAAYGRFNITSNGATNGGNQEQDQFSQEFRFTSTGWDNLNLTAGLFYWEQQVDRYFEREIYLCTAPGANATDANGDLLSPDPAITACDSFIYGFGAMNSAVKTDNWAMFGQADWRFADRWTVSLGLRYTEDDVDFTIERNTPNPGPAVPASFSGGNQVEESAVSGKLALKWEVSDEVMLYASYAEGYKAPAFDLIFATGANRMAPVPKETSEAWELGMKGELFDNRLRLGASVFKTKFKDLQGQGTLPNEIGFFLTSAGAAETQGVEVDFTAKPMANLLINGGFAYVDATFEDFPDSQCYAGQTAELGCIGGFQDLSGKQINNAPKLKASVQARYDIELDAPVDMFFSGTYRWQDDSPGSQNQDPRLFHDSYGIFDLVVGLESDEGHWSAQVFAKNLFDKFYEDLRAANTISGGVDHYLSRDAQRYMGVQVEYRFGAL